MRDRLGLVACPGVIALVLTVVGLSVFAGGADAANTRVTITDFQWSQNPSIDLNEKVIWDWPGPDTAHSVTGRGPGGVQVDSDPGNPFPQHRAGDFFEVPFDQPGIYTFACKIHPVVRGTVTVSDQPGDPDSDPGPAPIPFIDDRIPTLEEVAPMKVRLGPLGRGAGIRFAVDEKATADIEYWRLPPRGSVLKPRFMGFTQWSTHIGYNYRTYAARTAEFAAKPGRYEARLRVTDEAGNIAGPVRFGFEIASPPKKR